MPPPASSPDRAPPAPRPAPQPAPPTAGWQDRALTPGTWSYRAEAGGSIAVYGAPGGMPLLSLRCDRPTRRISLVREGMGQGIMTVRTSYGASSWPATTQAAPKAQTVAVRSATDAVLDQIAYSRGRFAVEVAGLSPLVLPPWAEVARVVEDCRGR
ncbi:hypothetical protein J3E64_003543 [Sphingobium sp. OAS761]|uniref:hypothetical protein n=1 Tax=Sphingobium sp. OAS761 TaxID=2817901 RepID=UPI0020A228B4|nr:hypothetical protein [Sphingobium sp. OAS761]MCP1471830.1 hypothetical protein [Sphingobium sp. OAS761]